MVQLVTGDSQEEVLIFVTNRHTLHHNIYIVIGGHWGTMTRHHHNDQSGEHLHHHRYLRASCSVTIAALHHPHHHITHHDSPVEYAGDCYDHHHCH